jgi:hypothetical protein
MSSPENGPATTVVIEMGPGWIYVKIAEPKPEPARIELLLGLTIDQWFNAHPQFVIDKKQAHIEHGALQGINVWYNVGARQAIPVHPEPSEHVFSLAIELHDTIRQQLPKEHIEAVLDESIQIWCSCRDTYGTMFVITPRRIAVVFDNQANRRAMVPVELIYTSIDHTAKTRYMNWLESPSTRLHAIQIPGSWFMPYDNKARTKIVEPSFIPTNMTYDPGPLRKK